MHDCLYVPTFNINLISISKLVQNGYKVEFTRNKAIISIKNLEIEATLKNSLFELNLPIKLDYSYFAENKNINTSEETIKLWYKRLGHRNLATIYKILNLPYKQINLNYKIYLKAKFINIINREITIIAYMASLPHYPRVRLSL